MLYRPGPHVFNNSPMYTRKRRESLKERAHFGGKYYFWRICFRKHAILISKQRRYTCLSLNRQLPRQNTLLHHNFNFAFRGRGKKTRILNTYFELNREIKVLKKCFYR